MRTVVMGIVNVTPDSFYDGGTHFEADEAIAFGESLFDEGADVLDIGGESTRPGARPVEAQEELRRVLPVVEALSSRCRISIDTRKADVARRAIAAGAALINDVSSSLAAVAAETGAGIVLMHMQGTPETMQDHPAYRDVVVEVFDSLSRSAERAAAMGVGEIYVDPGIGFGKTAAHNLALLRALPVLVRRGVPVVIGTSRKGFIGRISQQPGRPLLPASERFEGSLATAVYAMAVGVAAVRVHDVKPTADAARIVGDRPGVPGAPFLSNSDELASTKGV